MKILFIIAAIVIAQVVADSITITFPPGSWNSQLGLFQLNGNTAAENPNSNGYLLINRDQAGQAGSAFLKQSIALIGENGFEASFSTAFSFIMSDVGGGSDGDGYGADGIVFVVNSVTSNVGGAGGGIGYAGLPHSLGIEMDSWNNGAGIDISGNHIGIDYNGDVTSQGGAANIPARMNDGTEKFVWVDFDGATKTLEVRYSTSSARPSSPTISKNLDLVAILGSPNVYVGFTAATGAAWEKHIIKSWQFTNTYAPIPVVPAAVCGNGVIETGEQCDGGSCCSGVCTFASTSTVCRARNGDCDIEERCTGSLSTCPTNAFSPSTQVCRSSGGNCDIVETCTGASGSCPADSFQSSSTRCRESAGVCDVAENCTGTGAACPSNDFVSSSTVCRASAGVCDLSESCTGYGANCPSDVFSTAVCRASVGPCDITETCSGTVANCPVDVNGGFETACPGLGSFTEYDVISFGDFQAVSGDVEGRVAVAGDLHVGNGWSVGYKTHSVSSDHTSPYALFVGGSATMGTGAVFPDGSNHPYPGAQEGLFVAGTFTGPSYLGDLVTSCSDSSCTNNVASQFSAARSCYSGYSNSLASHSDNVDKLIQWSGLYLHCQSENELVYYVSLIPSELSQYTWISLDHCNGNARWVLNIGGTGDVTFTGGSFPAPAPAVVYNILGSGRTVNVQYIQLDGTLLAPNNVVNEPNGVIVGKVIAADISMSLQVNKALCFIPSISS